MKPRNHAFLIIIILTLLISCSSKSLFDNANPLNNKYLVKKIEIISTRNTQVLIYIYNGSKLKKMVVENSNEYVIYTYQGDYIIKKESFDANNVRIEYTEFTYTSNKLTQAKTYSNVLEAKFDYTFNSDGTTKMIETTYSNGSSYTNENKYYFDSAGNMIKEEDLRYSPPTTKSYIYDNKPTPFKNIIGWSKFLYSTPNNTLKATTTIGGTSVSSMITYSYQYNNQGYPISCTLSTDRGQPETTNYYY